MTPEYLILTPAIRREQLKSKLSRIQYLCIGAAAGTGISMIDPWWKDAHLVVLFLLVAFVVGFFKARVYRHARVCKPISVIDVSRPIARTGKVA
jgi:hypothetical protein